MPKNIEIKNVNGRITEAKELHRDGVSIGVVEGYIATWDVDRGKFGRSDQFVKGAFLESIRDLKKRKRQIRLKDQHGKVIGGFPIETVKEDANGLFGIGEVNIELEQGKGIFALVRQGVLVDFSIGFSVVDFKIEGDIRVITKAVIWEGSIVDEPMNPEANITGFKSLVPFQNLPLADRATEWDNIGALERVQDFTDSDDGSPSTTYEKAFLSFDSKNATSLSAYSFLIADVINDQLVIIPQAVIEVAESIKADESITEENKANFTNHLERYFAKMDMKSPFENSQKQYYVSADVKEWTTRQLEKALRKSGVFSKAAAKTIVSRLKGIDKQQKPVENIRNILDEIKSIEELL